MKQIFQIIISLILLGSLAASCLEPRYDDGECSEDADLRKLGNYYEGASCIDGKAQCPDGRAFCKRLAWFEEFASDQVIETCIGPCIECPNHGGACMIRNPETERIEYVCVHTKRDCWGVYSFIPLDSETEGCPTQSPDCR